MTLEEMQVANKKRTEAILGAWTKKPTGMTREMLKVYRDGYIDITSRLERIYARILSGVPSEDYYNVMTQRNRLETLQKGIVESYRKTARQAGLMQFDMSKTAFRNMYYQNMYAVNWFSKPYFAKVDEKALEVSVYGTDKIWESINKANRAKYKPYLPKHGTLSSVLNANATNDIKKIKNAVISGLRAGDSYVKVAKNLQKVFNTTASNAIRIARTEGNRNLNSGAYSNTVTAMEQGIELERMYLATLDLRTREQSGSMDGQTVPADQPFTYNGLSWYIPGNSGNPAYDIYDRCSSIDILPGILPEERRGRNPATGKNEVTNFKTFDEWAKDNNVTRDKNGKLRQRKG